MHDINYIRADIKGVSATCSGTSVPSTGGTMHQIYKQLPVISCYLQVSLVCSSFVVGVKLSMKCTI